MRPSGIEAAATGIAEVKEMEQRRVRQRYAHMRGRAQVVRFVAFGPTVEARSPEELVANTERAIMRMTRKLTPT